MIKKIQYWAKMDKTGQIEVKPKSSENWKRVRTGKKVLTKNTKNMKKLNLFK